MVERLERRREGLLQFREVLHPAGIGPHLATHMHFYPKGMTVQATAFVRRWQRRQSMCRFDMKDLKYFHALPVPRGSAAPLNERGAIL